MYEYTSTCIESAYIRTYAHMQTCNTQTADMFSRTFSSPTRFDCLSKFTPGEKVGPTTKKTTISRKKMQVPKTLPSLKLGVDNTLTLKPKCYLSNLIDVN